MHLDIDEEEVGVQARNGLLEIGVRDRSAPGQPHRPYAGQWTPGNPCLSPNGFVRGELHEREAVSIDLPGDVGVTHKRHAVTMNGEPTAQLQGGIESTDQAAGDKRDVCHRNGSIGPGVAGHREEPTAISLDIEGSNGECSQDGDEHQ